MFIFISLWDPIYIYICFWKNYDLFYKFVCDFEYLFKKFIWGR